MGGDLPPLPKGQGTVVRRSGRSRTRPPAISTASRSSRVGPRRPELREGLRCRLGGRPRAGQVTGMVPPIGSTVDIRECDLYQYDRRCRAEDSLDRSGIRSQLPCVLLSRVFEIPTPAGPRSRPINSASRRRTSFCDRQERAWSFTDLVHARPRRAQAAKPGLTVASLRAAGRRGAQ